jgi:hypothetical protein
MTRGANVTPSGVRGLLRKTARLPAHRCGDFCPRAGLPGTRASGYGPRLSGSPNPSPVKAPHRRVVVPAGRSPVASRSFACEAKPQAPHTGRIAPVPAQTKAGAVLRAGPVWLLHFKNASRSAPHEQVIGNLVYDRKEVKSPLSLFLSTS